MQSILKPGLKGVTHLDVALAMTKHLRNSLTMTCQLKRQFFLKIQIFRPHEVTMLISAAAC